MAVTVACREGADAIAVQESISSPWIRCDSGTGVGEVELGRALKNLIAIAVGRCDGLGHGRPLPQTDPGPRARLRPQARVEIAAGIQPGPGEGVRIPTAT